MESSRRLTLILASAAAVTALDGCMEGPTNPRPCIVDTVFMEMHDANGRTLKSDTLYAKEVRHLRFQGGWTCKDKAA